MRVFCLSSLEELAPYADDWDRLAAGVPFRSWVWQSTWWHHYGELRSGESTSPRLFVLCVFDLDDRLVGLAPLYIDSGMCGRTLRLLASGEVCSDYLGILCRGNKKERVAIAVADYLAEYNRGNNTDAERWDMLQLEGVDAADTAVNCLIQRLAQHGNSVYHRTGPNCWRIELPSSWDEYLAMLSKGHRKQLRRLQRNFFDTNRAKLYSVQTIDDIPRGMDLLVDLHQRRRKSLGEVGCFHPGTFSTFHREVMPRLLRQGQLHLHWLELDRQPVAAEYHLAGGDVVYAYQSGIEPDALEHQPGRIIGLAVLRRAIEQGYRAFDFLRGDEPYKAHYRAQPRPSLAVHVVPNRTAPRLRHGMYVAGDSVKRWIINSIKMVGSCRSGNESS
jgi:CelD/BcsL family acetyltransferase involved in cellulose biosynthesis